MRGRICVPMMALCLLLTGCGGTEETVDLRQRYHDMAGCTMEATVSCAQEGLLWEAELRCTYVPGGESTVEVLSPERIAGVKAVLDGTDQRLEYQGDCLDAGPVAGISPALCLPHLMGALRDGWLLEEGREDWDGVACVRLAVDRSGLQDGELVSAVWLRQEDGTPLRGEIQADGETILTAEFTSFTFYDTME